MKRTLIYISAVLTLAAFISACGGTETPANGTNSANVQNSNAPANKANGGPLDTQKTPPEQTTNNAPTLAPVYKAYCAAWVKKDEAALRKIYSSDTIQDFEKGMKEDGIRTLAEYLSDDKASNELCEARNEKIVGDTATAEVKTLGYPSGITVVFVKEGGEWKMTNKRPEGALK